MKTWLRHGAVTWAVTAVAWFALAPQGGRGGPLRVSQESQQDVHLPSGKSQRDEILKVARDQNMKDAAQLVEIAQQLQQDIEKNDRFVFSINTLKKTDEIEKLARKIRSRMRHN